MGETERNSKQEDERNTKGEVGGGEEKVLRITCSKILFPNCCSFLNSISHPLSLLLFTTFSSSCHPFLVPVSLAHHYNSEVCV